MAAMFSARNMGALDRYKIQTKEKEYVNLNFNHWPITISKFSIFCLRDFIEK